MHKNHAYFVLLSRSASFRKTRPQGFRSIKELCDAVSLSRHSVTKALVWLENEKHVTTNDLSDGIRIIFNSWA